MDIMHKVEPGHLAPTPARAGRKKLSSLLAMGALSVTGALGLAAVAGTASAAPTPAAVMATKVSVKMVVVSKYGPILETGNGLALYYDTANKPGKWACTGQCLKVWPALVLPKGQTKVDVGKGVTDISTIKGPAGVQVMWDKRPLYTFVKDKAGTIKGQGVAKVWFVAQLQAAPTGVAY
jgi:predicted lipoprotein with Yx(FWY)xxD motif